MKSLKLAAAILVLGKLTVPLASHISIASPRTEVKYVVNPQKSSSRISNSGNFLPPFFLTPAIFQAKTSQEKNDLAQMKLAQIPQIPTIVEPQRLPTIQIPTIPQPQRLPTIQIPTIQTPTIPLQIKIPKPEPLPTIPFNLPTFPQKLPGQDEIERNVGKLQEENRKSEEEERKRKLEWEESQRKNREFYFQEYERQHDLLRRLPENLRSEAQIAIGLHQKGEHQEGLKKLQWIVDVQRKNGNYKDAGTTLTVIVSIYNSLGRYTKALESSQKALAIQKKINDQEGVSTSLQYQGLIYQNLEQHSKALNFYQQALAIAKESNYKLKEGQILVDIGNVHIRQGNYSQAIELYEQSLTILKEIKQQEQVFKPFRNKSIWGDDYDIFSSQNQDHITLENAYYNIFSPQNQDHITLEIAEIEKTKTFMEELASRLSYNPVIYKEYSILEGRAFSGMGEASQNLGNYGQALELYQKALQIQKEINNKPEESRTLRKIGRVYVNQENYYQALDYYQQALKIAKETNDRAEEAENLNNIGFIYNTIEKYNYAETNLWLAVEAWESLRGGLSDEQKISIFEKQVSSYQFLQQALVAQNKTNTALEIAERGRARAFVELLASRLSSTSNHQISYNSPKIKDFQKIAQQRLSTIVQYSVINTPLAQQGKEESRPLFLYIWVIKPTGDITFKQINLKSFLNASFVDIIDKSRSLIGTRGRGGITVIPNDESVKKQQKNSLQRLYKLLIQPIASELPENPDEAVIFVPQGELFLLPFAALQDEKGKYLIEKHTIITTPSIQVLQLTNQQKIKNVNATTTKRPLIIGNPKMPSIAQEVGEQPQQLLSLPGAEEEALQIAEILNTQYLIGSSATETIVKRLIGSAGIIHLATHGLLDDFKEFGIPGAIALASSDQDDGLLTSNEIFDMKLNADLVVLSACDTGRGDVKGDGVIGLSRSFIAAGVPSVIVSLWAVSDNSTAFLMTNFYQNLQQNPNKATALRSAMLTTMKKYPEPLNWAAFTLIGES